MSEENMDYMHFLPRELSEEDKANIQTIKVLGNHLYKFINNLDLEDYREISLANTKLEEAVMWAVKGITKNSLPN